MKNAVDVGCRSVDIASKHVESATGIVSRPRDGGTEDGLEIGGTGLSIEDSPDGNLIGSDRDIR